MTITGHLVRRGVEHVHNHFTKQDAQMYENAAPEMDMKPQEFIPVAITILVAAFIMWSINYTVGHVMATLAMIESPFATAVIESVPPPPYTDKAEKEPLMATEPETETDIEVTIIDHKPITSKISTTIAHLHRIGGFRARWRGVGLSALYHLLHSMMANVIIAGFDLGLVGQALAYIFVSVGLARVHMAWTHKMISHPTTKPWYRTVPARKDCKAILLPSFVYAVAQQATIVIPVFIAIAMEHGVPLNSEVRDAMHHRHAGEHDCGKIAAIALRLLIIPTAYIALALGLLLPAAATLARVEASMLPEGEEAIVPFDKVALIGDIDVNARGGSRALFSQTWKSFDSSAKLRVIKLYAKLIMAQLAVAFVAIHLVVAEMYVIGGERLAVAMKSGVAQLKQMAAEAHEAEGQ